MVILDEENQNPVRCNLVTQSGMRATVMSLTHPDTLLRIWRLMDGGKCAGVWLKLKRPSTSTRKDARARKQQGRIAAAAALVFRLIAMEKFVVMDADESCEAWKAG